MAPREEVVNGKNFSLPKPVISPKKFIRRKGRITHPKPDRAPLISDGLSLILEATQMDK